MCIVDLSFFKREWRLLAMPMPDLRPKDVLTQLDQNELDKVLAINSLKFFLENGNEDNLRLEAMEILEQIISRNDGIFSFLENLVVSDPHDFIRLKAMELILNHHESEADDVLKWVYLNEKSTENLIKIYNILFFQKNERLMHFAKMTLTKRLSSMDEETREWNGYGSVERYMGVVQPYLLNKEYHTEHAYLKLDDYYREILRMAKELGVKNLNKDLAKVVQLLNDDYYDCIYYPPPDEPNEIYNREILEKMIKITRLGLCINPTEIKLLWTLGDAYKRMELFKKAVNVYEYLLDLEKSKKNDDYGKLLYILSSLYGDVNDLEKQIRVCESLVEIGFKLNYSLSLLGKLYRKNGEFGRAIEVLRTNLKNHPKHLQSLYRLGRAYQERGDLDDAILIFDLLTEDKKSGLLQIKSLNRLGEIFQLKKNQSATNYYYTKAFSINPTHSQEHKIVLAETLCGLGEFKSAFKTIERTFPFKRFPDKKTKELKKKCINKIKKKELYFNFNGSLENIRNSDKNY